METHDSGQAVQSGDLLTLRIRDCISRREFITAAGNYELHHFGAWQSNWFAANNEIEQELADLWKQANTGSSVSGPATGTE